MGADAHCGIMPCADESQTRSRPKVWHKVLFQSCSSPGRCMITCAMHVACDATPLTGNCLRSRRYVFFFQCPCYTVWHAGGLPLSWQDFSAYMLIDLSNNHLSGPLPNEPWAHVQLIDLSGNDFTGTLPESWKDMGLFFLDVRRNKLKGPLPAGWNQW